MFLVFHDRLAAQYGSGPFSVCGRRKGRAATIRRPIRWRSASASRSSTLSLISYFAGRPRRCPGGDCAVTAEAPLAALIRAGCSKAADHRRLRRFSGRVALICAAGDIDTRSIRARRSRPAMPAGDRERCRGRLRVHREEVALVCASHGGEPVMSRPPAHAGRSRARRGGSGVRSALAWKRRKPRASWRAPAPRPWPVHNNCSGKHAGMLAVALSARRRPIMAISKRDHAVQRRRRAISQRTRGWSMSIRHRAGSTAARCRPGRFPLRSLALASLALPPARRSAGAARGGGADHRGGARQSLHGCRARNASAPIHARGAPRLRQDRGGRRVLRRDPPCRTRPRSQMQRRRRPRRGSGNCRPARRARCVDRRRAPGACRICPGSHPQLAGHRDGGAPRHCVSCRSCPTSQAFQKRPGEARSPQERSPASSEAMAEPTGQGCRMTGSRSGSREWRLPWPGPGRGAT